MITKTVNILVVDDSPHMRKLIIDSLKKLGFKTYTTADNASEALNQLNQAKQSGSPIGLILSDLNMPGPSGMDFLKQIRSSESYSSLPFILITTESEKQAVIEAAINGVSGYIVKPFDVQTLSKRLVEAWTKHHGES